MIIFGWIMFGFFCFFLYCLMGMFVFRLDKRNRPRNDGSNEMNGALWPFTVCIVLVTFLNSKLDSRERTKVIEQQMRENARVKRERETAQLLKDHGIELPEVNI